MPTENKNTKKLQTAYHNLTVIKGCVLSMQESENQEALVEAILVYIDKALLNLSPQN